MLSSRFIQGGSQVVTLTRVHARLLAMIATLRTTELSLGLYSSFPVACPLLPSERLS